MNMKNKIKIFMSGLLVSSALIASQAHAHFQMIIPSDDMVQQDENRTLTLDVRFWHPYEGYGMNMVTPTQFGVMVDGQKTDLKGSLKPVKNKDVKGHMMDGFTVDYTLKKPGDFIFYIEPKPYWEPAEDKFIVHYTKVVVNGFGLEEGWDSPVGLKTEIVPLTRPYGLYAGNVFQGIVLLNGKPAPDTEVEVEYYNKDHKLKPVADPIITQRVKADSNGVFTYAMPKAGWWGFAALNEDDKKIKYEGEDKPIEIGALIWVETHDMK
jgi:nickel transport protein